MASQVYPSMQAVAFVKRQPAYNLLFFDHKDHRLTVGMNDEAAAIVTACDGLKPLSEIVNTLAERFCEDSKTVAAKLDRFLGQLTSLNLLQLKDRPHANPVPTLGTKEYLTPEHVVLELTHRCPLRCSHCFLDAGSGPTMDFARLTALLRQLLDTIGLRSVQLTGGEPLLYPNLIEVLDIIAAKGVPIQITTSGMAPTSKAENCLNRLVSPRNSVQISVDGFAETHNRIRGDPRSFDCAMRFLGLARDRGVKTYTATSLIDQPKDEVERLCAHMRDLGVGLFRIGAVSIQGRAKHLSTTWDANEARSFLRGLKEKYDTDAFHVGSIEDLSAIETDFNCGAGTKLLAIDPSFKVRPCPMTDIYLGDLQRETLETIARRGNEIFACMRAPDSESCGTCVFATHCRACFAEGHINAKRAVECKWLAAHGKALVSLANRGSS